MSDMLYFFQGTNGAIFVYPDRLLVTKHGDLVIPLNQIAAVQFHEGKLLQDGYLLVTTKQEEARSIFETMKDNEKAIMVSRKNSAAAQKFADQVEEYIYENFYE